MTPDYNKDVPDVGQRVQASSSKMNKFWRSAAQRSDCSSQYSIVCIRTVKRVDLVLSVLTAKNKREVTQGDVEMCQVRLSP